MQDTPMPKSFPNWTSRIVIAGRILECRRSESRNAPTMPGDHYLPFGRVEAQAKAARWLWQSYII
jgi:hypothetical protein